MTHWFVTTVMIKFILFNDALLWRRLMTFFVH